jgi:hypothetical protein
MAVKGNSCFLLISKGDNHYLKNSSHLEWRVGLSDTILKGTHQGTIYARFGPYIDASCQVCLHFAKPSRAILVSYWLLFQKIFSSETAWQNGDKLGRKHLCKVH